MDEHSSPDAVVTLSLEVCRQGLLPERFKDVQFVGHRGALAGDTEGNSYAALWRAKKLGIASEVDVRLAEGRLPVLAHGAAYSDRKGRERRIRDMAKRQHKKIGRDDGYGILLLAEAYEYFPDMAFMLDLKVGGAESACARVLEVIPNALERTLVICSPERVFRSTKSSKLRRGKGLPRCFAVRGEQDLILLERLASSHASRSELRKYACSFRAISLPYSLMNWTGLELWLDAGFGVFVYLTKTASEARECIKRGLVPVTDEMP